MSLREENLNWLRAIQQKFGELPVGEVGADGVIENEFIEGILHNRMVAAEAAAAYVTAINTYQASLLRATKYIIGLQRNMESVSDELTLALRDSGATDPLTAAAELANRVQDEQTSVLTQSQEIDELLEPATLIEDKLLIPVTSGTAESDPVGAMLNDEAIQTVQGRDLVVNAIEDYINSDNG